MITGRKHSTPLFTIYGSQDMEATQVFMNRWMDKENGVCVYTHNGNYSTTIKEWNIAICSNVDEPREEYYV